MNDNVIKPSHYANREHEPIDVMKDWLENNEHYDAWQGFLVGQVLKYLARAGMKDDFKQDLDKAYFYMTMLVGDDPRKQNEKQKPWTHDYNFGSHMTFGELKVSVETWACERGLHKSDPRVQLNKVFEEVGELAEGINKDNEEMIIDGLGDTMVTLIILAMQLDYDIIRALEFAYNEIKDREGKVINGQFVKEEDL